MEGTQKVTEGTELKEGVLWTDQEQDRLLLKEHSDQETSKPKSPQIRGLDFTPIQLARRGQYCCAPRKAPGH
jgi:hypothetical protein